MPNHIHLPPNHLPSYITVQQQQAAHVIHAQQPMAAADELWFFGTPEAGPESAVELYIEPPLGNRQLLDLRVLTTLRYRHRLRLRERERL